MELFVLVYYISACSALFMEYRGNPPKIGLTVQVTIGDNVLTEPFEQGCRLTPENNYELQLDHARYYIRKKKMWMKRRLTLTVGTKEV